MVPFALFLLLMAALYIPGVQNLLRREATAYASEATGMDVQVERIDLRFPLNLLVRGVQVVDKADTLLSLQSLNIHIQALPLLRGQVQVDDIALKQVDVNSAGLIPGMSIRGTLGRFLLRSHGVNLLRRTVVLNEVELGDTQVELVLADTTEAVPDTAAASAVALDWKVDLRRLAVDNVSFSMQLPYDSVSMAAQVGSIAIDSARVDLQTLRCEARRLALDGGLLAYDVGTALPADGFDPSHIALRDIRLQLDSLLWGDRQVNAVLRQFALNERSGLSVDSFAARVFANDSVVRLPYLRLATPHSEIRLSADTRWELLRRPTQGNISTRLEAHIGKEDVMLFAGSLPQSFRQAYPFHPLVVRAGTEGNLSRMQVSGFSVELPGAFAARGGAVLENLLDSVARSGKAQLRLSTGDLNFLTALGGSAPTPSLQIPDSMRLQADLDMQGSRYDARLRLDNKGGLLDAVATLDAATQRYRATLTVDSLCVDHFLPNDSIYELSLEAKAEGQGFDFMDPATQARAHLRINRLHYADLRLSNVEADAHVNRCVAAFRLAADNQLIEMQADGNYHLARPYPVGKATVDVARLDLHRLGIAPQPLKRTLSFRLAAEAQRDSLAADLTAGDLRLSFAAAAGVTPFLERVDRFVALLGTQIEQRRLNHAELRRTLPVAELALSAGRENPAAYYLESKDIGYQDIRVDFHASPAEGINGNAVLRALKVDTLQLDTISLAVAQDTTQMSFRMGVVNTRNNPHLAFAIGLTGAVYDENAQLLAEYKDQDGRTGIRLGVNARPLTFDEGRLGGVAIEVIPKEPVIAYRKFHFVENHNHVFLHNNMRVSANIDMLDSQGMGFRVHSAEQDTVSLQNMDIRVTGIRLAEIADMIPYLPAIAGTFSAEAQYVQTREHLRLSGKVGVDELTYERKRVGDIELGATWLPGEAGKQFLHASLARDRAEIITADGKLDTDTAGVGRMDVKAALKHLPLNLVNVFVPDEALTAAGDLNGEVRLAGTFDKPSVAGELSLDSATLFSPQYGVRFRLDERPVVLADNQLKFDKFAIYTTGNNPFTIDGVVDFRNLSAPTAELSMQASNYLLLDAKQTRQSLVYGKILADFMATVRGPLDGLTMRGNMNLLGSTNVSYVLTDSPLTVQDRLGSLVSFTSFSDTTAVVRQEVPTVSLGGLDMLMVVHIDPSVRLKVDLDDNGGDRVELEGGGDLSLKYTPQGDMTLTGRYTLTGGVMKYSLPVIAAKEFSINNGSYVEWTGNLMDPSLNFTATDRIRASVSDGDDSGTRMVNFDVSIVVKNRLDNLSIAFDVSAPEDAAIQNELAAMGAEERGKQALYIMVAKTYLGTGPIGDSGSGGLGNLNMGAALNSVLSSQINSLMGNLKNASVSVGIEDHDAADAGGKRTDYSFRYSQRFFNDRFQIIIGGKVSTGENATNDAESFIDNISLEYRLDRSGTRYVRLFYDKNYESVLEGEITETGVGLVLRKKLDKLGELFIFKRK